MNNSIELRLVLIDSGVELPTYAYRGDAGLDLSSSIDLELQPFERRPIPTGLAIAIPEGYAGLILPRSGLALREGLSMINTPGLIDSHYRGELVVAAVNLDPHKPIAISRGDRIAQLVIISVPFVEVSLVENLDATTRGSKGFGSSGV